MIGEIPQESPGISTKKTPEKRKRSIAPGRKETEKISVRRRGATEKWCFFMAGNGGNMHMKNTLYILYILCSGDSAILPTNHCFFFLMGIQSDL